MELVKTKMPRFRMYMHLNCADGGHCLYRDDEMGIEMKLFTPKKNGEWGKGERTYFIDGDDREFTDQAAFLKAVEEKEAAK